HLGRGRGERGLDVERQDAEQRLALEQLARKVLLAAGDAAPELVAPRLGAVRPRFDRVLPAAELGHLERAGEAVVPERLEGSLRPAALTPPAVPDPARDSVGSVAEDRRLDLDGLADCPLDREPAAVELRRDVLDPDPGRVVSRAGRGHDGRTGCPIRQPENRGSARAFERRPPPPDLAARWPARRRGLSLRRLARRPRAVVVAGPSARPAPRAQLPLPRTF